ncbi:MAG: aminopeptidase P family protein [Alphaproteobacteria bacterium]
MFQSFDTLSDPSHGAARARAVREKLAEQGWDGFIVPRADEHQGEYVPPHAERLAWLTGFTGSAGAAVVLKDQAAIFVDGRYTLQVRDQVDTEIFEPLDIIETPVEDWLARTLQPGQVLAYDPWLHTPAGVEKLEKACAKAGAECVAAEENPLDAVWTDQPEPPRAEVRPHGQEFAGESSESKRERIAKTLAEGKTDAALLTLPDSIAWLYNIRGGDVPHTPLPLSFSLLHRDGHGELFIHPDKVTNAVRNHLGNQVTLRRPEELVRALEALGKAGASVRLDPQTAPARLRDVLERAGAKLVKERDPCLLPKACKNETEREGARAAHRRDGAAVSRFLAWLAREAPKGELDEIAAAKQLESFRAETGELEEISFDTISGAGPNGAIVHYRVSTATSRKLEPGTLYLVDSGAQYRDGTTDITRTVAVGEPTEEMRERFTRVLMGHIDLARAVFPEGTAGVQLDTLARQALWQAGLDYDHGTGHGVGAYLGVHEGPQNLSKRLIDVALKPGMICSNEPGYYKTGEYGIRIENLVLVTEPETPPGGERPMMGFETLTLAPIDLTLVKADLLSPEQREWLNAYHARVREELADRVDAETAEWLKEATRAV